MSKAEERRAKVHVQYRGARARRMVVALLNCCCATTTKEPFEALEGVGISMWHACRANGSRPSRPTFSR
jgi:hypothetical protein